ncbi:hypothetical protein BJ684DRAFT_19839 [Piptocephalis cylindrospora]|uniref:Cyclin N-terminal domain-containing protein n=1 Tax=Piptocephalis cylindrospora TaxID=1907219 RepID=A0A4P9Y414_9FUNG|nr:hypothetical protein BJ684DRAFT_19839 [Piptocephalis cylindrospora]|eukprot:RKP13696.1 hypothetical protein BJ684DRAFT_19839 [Piptocephalis cylindrospora]
MGSMAQPTTSSLPTAMVDYKGRISFTTTPEQMTSTSPKNVERYGFSKGVPPEWNNWVFETKHLYEMPSVKLSSKMRTRHRPMSPREDALVRAKAFNFLSDICHQLNMSRIVWATACSIVHRFYMKRSHQRHIYYDICAAALYIACKDSDFGPDLNPHLVKQVAARAFKTRGDAPLPDSTVEFDVTMEHPHHHLARAALANPGQYPRAVWVAAYRFVDAAHVSMTSILHPPRVIAAAALAWALNYACCPSTSSAEMMHQGGMMMMGGGGGAMMGGGPRKSDVTPPYDPALSGFAGLSQPPKPTVRESYYSWPKTLGVPNRVYGEVLKMWKDPRENALARPMASTTSSH